MADSDKIINDFSTRVRQLILQYQNLKKENNDLYTMVDERDKKIAELKDAMLQQQKEFDALKMARMIETTDNDIETAKSQIAKLIRDVNQCITLLGEK